MSSLSHYLKLLFCVNSSCKFFNIRTVNVEFFFLKQCAFSTTVYVSFYIIDKCYFTGTQHCQDLSWCIVVVWRVWRYKRGNQNPSIEEDIFCFVVFNCLGWMYINHDASFLRSMLTNISSIVKHSVNNNFSARTSIEIWKEASPII
jgi:hypothetical protein